MTAHRGLTPTELQLEERREALKIKDGYCYFAFTQGDVKIGFTRNWRDRLRVLRTGVPGTLDPVVVIKGNLPLERELHARFDHLRKRGEWFAAAPEIDEYLRAIPIEDRIR